MLPLSNVADFVAHLRAESGAGKQADDRDMLFKEQAASDGLALAGKDSGGNPALMVGGLLLASAGGWVWSVGSFVSGIGSLIKSIIS